MQRLTDDMVQRARIGEHLDATPGLILMVRAAAGDKSPRRSWVFRFTLAGKRQRVGLGAYPAVKLADARNLARSAAVLVAKGQHPSSARPAPAPASVLTFKAAVAAYLPIALERLSSDHGKRDLTHALTVLCAPLHNRPIAAIGARETASLLKTIHARAPARAAKVRIAMRGLFAYAQLVLEDQGGSTRNPMDPAALKAAGYAPRAPEGHRAALDHRHVAAFMAELRANPSPIARLVEFAILTVARVGAAQAARFEQIDVANSTWIVPAAQLKDRAHRKGKPFRVPLVPLALEIVEEMRASSRSELIFDGMGGTAPIGFLRRMSPRVDAVSGRLITVHGFRSTFRSWCQAEGKDRAAAEIAMGHRYYAPVEARYAMISSTSGANCSSTGPGISMVLCRLRRKARTRSKTWRPLSFRCGGRGEARRRFGLRQSDQRRAERASAWREQNPRRVQA
jgi:integrase